MPKKAQQPHHKPLRTGSNASNNPDRVAKKGDTHARDKATIKRLNMYKARPVRTKTGKLVGGAYMSKSLPKNPRIEPNRRWFGNTRTVGQKELETFREELQNAQGNPYQFMMRSGKVPYGLLKDADKQARMHILEVESFSDTFGPKRRRKKPNLNIAAGGSADMASFAAAIEERGDGYEESKDRNVKTELDYRSLVLDPIFEKGQSKRIWSELYKVVDSSDVLIQVLDVRDPMGTRSRQIEQHLKKDRKHKHLIFVLNKCDLVPTWVTARWVKVLSREYPTLAFHASITHPFGKGALIQLLQQFAKLHQDRKQICVGFIGYPNVGKSSIINTLRSKKVCNVAPIPGETKVWQYITLFRRIFLIDCPGVVHASNDSETEIVLKGVVRVENLKNADDYIEELLKRVKPEYITKTYGIPSWKNAEDFLTQYAVKSGRLLKKAEPDLNTVAKMVLYDWLRGSIPYFVPPPFDDDKEQAEEGAEAIQVNQRFGNIRVAMDFNEEELEVPEQLQGELDLEAGEEDWDEVHEDVVGDPVNSMAVAEGDEEEEEDVFDSMVDEVEQAAGKGKAKAKGRAKKGKEVMMSKDDIVRMEFASDSEEEEPTATELLKHFDVVDTVRVEEKVRSKTEKKKRRRMSRKRKREESDDEGEKFSIVRERVTTRRKVGTHFYKDLQQKKGQSKRKRSSGGAE
mmetsp:Transcript_17521/g.67980  ORF Transcript_17521/g.67980 Transcript_17521/m.67980 type:complete len:685 (+) Transcript_17521:81-2135(+)